MSPEHLVVHLAIPGAETASEHSHRKLVTVLCIECIPQKGREDVSVDGGAAVKVVDGKKAGGDGEEAEVETGADGCVGERTRRGGLADKLEVRGEEWSLSEGQRAQWRLSSERQARHLRVGY